MDFSSRGYQRNNEGASATQPTSATPGSAPQSSVSVNTNKSSASKNQPVKRSKFILVLSVVLGISISILSILIILGIATRSSEKSYVDSEKFQAVFLNGGQVYFGNIKELNSGYLTLGNIFYLNVANSSVQPESNNAANQNITLVKLGCELHGPQDNMVINRDQVQFWENLNDNGKVVKTITEWQKANPNGQKCETATNTSTTTNSSTPTPTTTPTPTPTPTTTTSGR